MLRAAKPRLNRSNPARSEVDEDLFARDSSASSSKTKATLPRADNTVDVNDIFADIFSSTSSETRSTIVGAARKPTNDDDVLFTTEPVKTTAASQAKKASAVTNAFSIDDEDDDIFAVKPSSIMVAKSPAGVAPSSVQKVCYVIFFTSCVLVTFRLALAGVYVHSMSSFLNSNSCKNSCFVRKIFFKNTKFEAGCLLFWRNFGATPLKF